MAEEKIKLTDLLEVCLDFKRNPTNENFIPVQQMINRLVVKEYLPLADKITQIALILGSVATDKFDQFEAETWLTIGKVVYGILAYVDNIENNLDKLSMNAEVVDLLYEMGVVDAILEHCEKDYQRLEKMLDETMNFSNIFKIVETTSLYTSDSINQFIETIKGFKTDLTPEMLKSMEAIANAQSPEFQAFKETVADEVLNKVMKEDMKELNKKVEQPEPESEKQPEEPKEA